MSLGLSDAAPPSTESPSSPAAEAAGDGTYSLPEPPSQSPSSAPASSPSSPAESSRVTTVLAFLVSTSGVGIGTTSSSLALSTLCTVSTSPASASFLSTLAAPLDAALLPLPLPLPLLLPLPLPLGLPLPLLPELLLVLAGGVNICSPSTSSIFTWTSVPGQPRREDLRRCPPGASGVGSASDGAAAAV